MVQKEHVLEKSLRRKAVNISAFAFLGLVAMESVVFEFVGIYGVSCITNVFEKAVKKHCEI